MYTIRNVIQLLSPPFRWRMLVLFLLMLIGMLFETLSVGLVIPVISMFTVNSATQGSAAAVWLSDLLGLQDKNQVILVAMIGLVGVYALKTVFLAFLAWRQASFSFDVRADISRRLFEKYLSEKYEFHLRRNSAELIRNIVSETDQFTNGAMAPSMLLTAELLVATGLGVLLMVVEPIGAIVVITTFGIAGGLFLLATRLHLTRWGTARQMHEGKRLQMLQQGLGGVKEVKLMGRERDFINQYDFHNRGSSAMGMRQATLLALPKLWIELLAILGLAALVISMVLQGKPIDNFVPTLGLFAAAAFRIMPSINRMINAMQSLRFALPVVDVLRAELRGEEIRGKRQADTGGIPFNGSLDLQDVAYSYPQTDDTVLTDINLRIPAGASLGIVGESGAGKSTLIDLIMGLLPEYQGHVHVDGRELRDDIHNWQRQIGYVPQHIFLTDDTLRRNIAFGLEANDIDEALVDKAIKAAQLQGFVASLPAGKETIVGERGVRLSGGQRQRIGIARALYHDPSILVLDEATSALDVRMEAEVMDAVRKLRDKTVIIVAHRYSTVEHCEMIVLLEKGRIVRKGTPDQVLTSVAPK